MLCANLVWWPCIARCQLCLLSASGRKEGLFKRKCGKGSETMISTTNTEAQSRGPRPRLYSWAPNAIVITQWLPCLWSPSLQNIQARSSDVLKSACQSVHQAWAEIHPQAMGLDRFILYSSHLHGYSQFTPHYWVYLPSLPYGMINCGSKLPRYMAF